MFRKTKPSPKRRLFTPLRAMLLGALVGIGTLAYAASKVDDIDLVEDPVVPKNKKIA